MNIYISILAFLIAVLTSCSVVSKNGYRQSRKYKLSKTHILDKNKKSSSRHKAQSEIGDTLSLFDLQSEKHLALDTPNQKILPTNAKKIEIKEFIASKERHNQENEALNKHYNVNAKFGAKHLLSPNKPLSKVETKANKSSADASTLFTASIILGLLALISSILFLIYFTLNTSLLLDILIILTPVLVVMALLFSLIGLPRTLQESYTFGGKLAAVLWTLVLGIVTYLLYLLYFI